MEWVQVQAGVQELLRDSERLCLESPLKAEDFSSLIATLRKAAGESGASAQVDVYITGGTGDLSIAINVSARCSHCVAEEDMRLRHVQS